VNVRALALLPIPLIFAAGACTARWWFARAPSQFAADLAQPYVIVTSWGVYGAAAFALLATTLACATVALIFAARTLGRDPKPGNAAAVIVVAGLAIAGAFAWPFAFSSDPYAYAAYGAMVRDGLDPYALLPLHAHGAFYEAARWQWSGTYPVCVYGPAFVAIAAAAVAAFSVLGVGATLWALRIATALAFLGSIGCLRIALGGRPRRESAIALYAYGLNPVILWTVAEGHNDAWLLLAVMGAAALARTKPRLGAFALGASLIVKAPGAAFALGALVDGRLRLRRDRAAINGWLAAGLAFAAGPYLALMRPAFAALGAHGKYAPAVSIQGLIGPLPALALAVAAASYGVASLARGLQGGYAWLGIALLVGLPSGYPWYAVWLVPFALAGGPGRASIALWGATISSVLRYLPDAVGDIDPLTARALAVAAALPLLYALTEIPFAALRKKVPSQP
jgi:alpha-1,6-mannosyltransferase